MANLMPQSFRPDLDRLMPALALVALLLYLAPAAIRPLGPESRLWLRRASVATLALGIAIAVAASLRWLLN
jgi:hypothetical protein